MIVIVVFYFSLKWMTLFFAPCFQNITKKFNPIKTLNYFEKKKIP